MASDKSWRPEGRVAFQGRWPGLSCSESQPGFLRRRTLFPRSPCSGSGWGERLLPGNGNQETSPHPRPRGSPKFMTGTQLGCWPRRQALLARDPPSPDPSGLPEGSRGRAHEDGLGSPLYHRVAEGVVWRGATLCACV